ncbi:molybdopterin molybdotransferase MoeA [Proteobacteria bacterium 005FR1]|nr:molybdopterin molybdotransferase MoeA [Proteobacteria bacterium 005FR1]
MLSVEEATRQLLASVNPLADVEEVGLLDAYHRVLASPHFSRTDVPPADVSAMDGYAVKAADCEAGSWIPVSQRIPAGKAPVALKPGTAARIFTGGVIPPGADAVVIQENCETDDNRVRFLQQVQPGDHLRPRGQDMQKDSQVLPAGRLLMPQDLGVLAGAGIERVNVFRRLRVAVLASGDELVEPGQALAPGQIYNANRYTLHGLLSGLNIEVRHYPPIPDSFAATEAALQLAAGECDLVISTGGVSVGEEDHIKEAVTRLGELQLWKLKMKPGKPLAYGCIGSTPFFGLPGNPVAVFVTFIVAVRPYLLAMQGAGEVQPETARIPAAFAVERANSRQEYVRVRIEQGQLHIYRSQDSGVMSSTSWANALAIIPPNTTISPGDELEAIPYSHLGIL